MSWSTKKSKSKKKKKRKSHNNITSKQSNQNKQNKENKQKKRAKPGQNIAYNVSIIDIEDGIKQIPNSHVLYSDDTLFKYDRESNQFYRFDDIGDISGKTIYGIDKNDTKLIAMSDEWNDKRKQRETSKLWIYTMNDKKWNNVHEFSPPLDRNRHKFHFVITSDSIFHFFRYHDNNNNNNKNAIHLIWNEKSKQLKTTKLPFYPKEISRIIYDSKLNVIIIIYIEREIEYEDEPWVNNMKSINVYYCKLNDVKDFSEPSFYQWNETHVDFDDDDDYKCDMMDDPNKYKWIIAYCSYFILFNRDKRCIQYVDLLSHDKKWRKCVYFISKDIMNYWHSTEAVVYILLTGDDMINIIHDMIVTDYVSFEKDPPKHYQIELSDIIKNGYFFDRDKIVLMVTRFVFVLNNHRKNKYDDIIQLISKYYFMFA